MCIPYEIDGVMPAAKRELGRIVPFQFGLGGKWSQV
jgi:hypothetical protein